MHFHTRYISPKSVWMSQNCFTESLEMYYFTLAQEFNYFINVRVIWQLKYVIIYGTCFLFCCNLVRTVLAQTNSKNRIPTPFLKGIRSEQGFSLPRLRKDRINSIQTATNRIDKPFWATAQAFSYLFYNIYHNYIKTSQ